MYKEIANSKYFDYNNEDNFWEDIASFTVKDNNEYLKSKASNVVSLSNIIFSMLDGDVLKENFFVGNNSGTKRLVFENCIFYEDVDFSKYSVLKELKFTNCKFRKKTNLSLRPLHKLTIDNCQFNDELIFDNVIVEDKNRLFLIKNSSIDKILDIDNCYFEYAQFYNINLLDATLKISDSNLIGMKCNNIKWSKKYDCNRDTFRQLKVVMENHKNFIDANFFHSLELNEYRKELSNSNDKLEEKILFNFNWLVSEFSISWFRPIILLILFSVLLYCILCYNNLITECSVNDFFKFFNPLSRTSSDYNNIYWIWFSHKILSGFLIYHFIVSLKRYTRF